MHKSNQARSTSSRRIAINVVTAGPNPEGEVKVMEPVEAFEVIRRSAVVDRRLVAVWLSRDEDA